MLKKQHILAGVEVLTSGAISSSCFFRSTIDVADIWNFHLPFSSLLMRSVPARETTTLAGQTKGSRGEGGFLWASIEVSAI